MLPLLINIVCIFRIEWSANEVNMFEQIFGDFVSKRIQSYMHSFSSRKFGSW